MSTTRPSAPSGTRERSGGAPLGIKILCVVSGLFNVLLLFLGVAALGGGAGPLGLGGLIIILSSGLSLAALYGLWTLRPWGWTLYLIVQGFAVLNNLIQVDVIPAIIGILLWVYVLSKGDLYRANR